MLEELQKLITKLKDLVEQHVQDSNAKKSILEAIKEVDIDSSKRIVNCEARLMKCKKNTEQTHWLTRLWRPITMLSFVLIIVLHSFGWLVVEEIHDEMWTLIQIGLGGYVVGRSAEKIVAKLNP
ncbi:MAG: hypothetical protein IIA17_12195 [candidate division Zixibacteria bacterium]|nr:hypothetical protein [candidate division Zixibacteria bacterium]